MPRRDIGNEVIVALAAVGMLALALAFGAVLTISRSLAPNNSGSTATLIAQVTLSTLPPTGTAQTTEEATSAATEPITETATETATDTPTELLTQAATDIGTAIGTESAAATSTFTRVPTSTPTSIFTLTPTPPPSETPATSATPTSEFATFTREPGDATEQMKTIEAIIKPRLTLTAFASMTFAEVVATQTENALITPTDITSGSPTDYPDFIDTPTPGGAVTAIPAVVVTSAQLAGCVIKAGWVPYIIQPNDTLFRLSVKAGITLQQLQQANCISDPSKIYYGQVIVVPPNSELGTPGSTVSVTAGAGTSGTTILSGANVTACSNLAARITAPMPGTTVRGTITISGAATIPNFDFYKLDVRADSSAVWNNFMLARTPVTNGPLGTLNTGLFTPGIYWIQLTVIDKTGNYPILPCAERLQFAP